MDRDQIIEEIKDEAGLDDDEIKEEVEAKMEEFSGLVSEEGALHLVAKENEVEIAEAAEQELKIGNIVPEMRKVDVKGRVLNISDENTFERDEGEEGKVQNIVIGDETGTIRLTLWDDQTEIAEKVEEDNVIVIESAYSVEDDRENAELRLGDSSQVKLGDQEDVPDVERSGGSSQETDIRDISSEGANYIVTGMLMDVYTSNPFYRIDPETGDTVRKDDDGNYVTDDGKKVDDPDHRLAVSGVLDDGTGNVRAVFFGGLAREVLGIDEEEEKEGDIDAVEKAAEDVIGTELEIEGRSRYNDYFGRLELIANSATEIDAGQQLEELLAQMEA